MGVAERDVKCFRRYVTFTYSAVKTQNEDIGGK